MKLQHYGEDRLIATLCRGFETGKRVIVGIGDDCAVIGGKTDRCWQLLKTDAVIEGIHFLGDADPRKVGWKAMARAVSDVAAMGGLPMHALVTIAAPAGMKLSQAKALYAGIRKCCKRFGISLVGGETARSPGPLFLNVTLAGEVERHRCVLRSGGRPGDLLYVPAGSAGRARESTLDFVPRVEEARWLTENFRLHAMMDLSDGLGADLPRLARASGVGFELGALPCNKASTHEGALSDGEDYELLFALPRSSGAKLERLWAGAFPRLPLTRIGRLTASGAAKLKSGHDHFA